MPRERIPQTAVLEWLATNHTHLHESASIERDWIWLADVNLAGDQNKPVRESLKEFGFRFGREHTLPDGRIARWAHACEKPIPFRRKKSSPETKGDKPSASESPNESGPEPQFDAEAKKFFDSY